MKQFDLNRKIGIFPSIDYESPRHYEKIQHLEVFYSMHWVLDQDKTGHASRELLIGSNMELLLHLVPGQFRHSESHCINLTNISPYPINKNFNIKQNNQTRLKELMLLKFKVEIEN